MEYFAKVKYNFITGNELDRRGKSFIFCIINNQRCFLIGDKGVIEKLPTRFPISVTEQMKTKLIDQAIQLQMGKTPKQYKKEIRTYWCVKESQLRAGSYTAYELTHRDY